MGQRRHHERVSDTTTTPPAVPGLVLGQVIGRGATSTVWSAIHVETGQAVAVKITTPDRLHVGQLMELAARETAILAKVEHDHLVRLHDAHPLPDGSVAVVLDLARGGSLAELVAARGRLDGGEVATICTPLAGALAALHAAGVVHGDVSPGNILFTPDGKPLLSDFEAARLVGESHPPLVAGTSGFVAPEVIDGDVPGEAADVFGLGALAWFALTGRAWSVRSWADPLGTHTPGPEPVGVDEAVAVLGPGFGPAVAAMLAADPAGRPSAQEAAVLAYQAARPVPVRLVGSAAGTDPDRVLTQRLRGPASRSGPGVSGDLPDSAEARRVTSAQARQSTRRGEPGLARRAGPKVRFGLVAAPAIVSVAALVGVFLRLSPAATAEGPGPHSGNASTGAPTVAATSATGLAPGASTATATATVAASAVLREMVARRAQALIDRDPTALGAADASGSKQLDADVAIVTELQRAGQRFAGLGFSVTSAEWVSVDGGSARIRAVVERSGYRVLGPGSQDQSVVADPGRSLLYLLVRVPDGWRIAEVTE